MTASGAAHPYPFSLKTKIITPKLAETRDFYVGLFGLSVVDAWDSRGDVGVILGFSDRAGEAFLEIYQGEETHDFSGLNLQFRVDSVAAFQATVGDRAIMRGPVQRLWGATYLYLTDPNGVEVMVFEGGL